MKPPLLTKKHFEYLADALAAARHDCAALGIADSLAVDVVVERMVQHLERTNPQFDRTKFMDACHHGQRLLDFQTNA